ncbi:hypothetical protein [Streptomyces sp. TLI_185]|uniref:hypothetical protein n=1 Tax=Streptomyces sp. TLI_185 TaxID=2485151 RepID=UPI000F50DF43|nr:hypothetical protein [Streptomyces sp. TLI_185]RPF39110.1 hypothetical protein EDD92_9303 [Streptomyces sp. TLI_185]
MVRLIDYPAAFDPADRHGTDGRQGAGLRTARVPYWWMPVEAALPVLARSIVDGEGDEACHYWGSTVLFALQLLAQGRLKPTVTVHGFDAWHTAPQPGEERERFDQLDAVADTLPRTPAAPALAGMKAFTARPPQHIPHLVPGADRSAASGPPASVQISLRLDISEAGTSGVRAVVMVHDTAPPHDVVEAARLWREPPLPGSADAARQMGMMVALRGAARAWPPLARMVPVTGLGLVECGGDHVLGRLDEGGGEPLVQQRHR